MNGALVSHLSILLIDNTIVFIEFIISPRFISCMRPLLAEEYFGHRGPHL